ncbi:MAG: diacylglycerol kinase family lipid kinase [Clostridia bacterium]|nr:diacylglycerol kinase family lipid kinase [Clostridia bacterium]
MERRFCMYYFIINPVSRSGKGLEIWKQAENTLKEKNLSYKPYFTKYSGHGTLLAKEIAPLAAGHILVVIGGDGTINEVINGLPLDHSIQLAYLPVGSGNDFARGLDLSLDSMKSLEDILLTPHSQSIDIGTLKLEKQSSRFAISSGIGYDAEICYEVSHTPVKKWLNRLHLGKLTYAYAAIRLLFHFQPADMDVEIDDTQRYHFKRMYFIAAMNLQYEGGGFRFCPEASYQDGSLDYLIVHDLGKLFILLMFPSAYFAKHTSFRGITILRGKKMRIHSQQAYRVHRDGEYAGLTDTITFDTKKQALDMIL